MFEVIILDDEVWVAKMICRLIDWEGRGFRVAGVFHDGEEGLQAIGKLRPQLVLTDIRMPGKTGLDIIREASAAYPDTLFVMISGYSDFEYAKTALTYGAIGYLLKPIDQRELEKAVDKAERLLMDRQSKQHSERELRATVSQTIEKLREQFFRHYFDGLQDRQMDVEQVNADLKLNFRPGGYLVASLAVERTSRSTEISERVVRTIWEAGLPADCAEVVVLEQESGVVLLLNFAPELAAQVDRDLENLFQSLQAARLGCGITMGVSSPVDSFCALPGAYRAAREMELARLLHGQNQIYRSQRQAVTCNDRLLLPLGYDISLKQAFDCGDVDAVRRLSDEAVDYFALRAARNPAKLMRGASALLELYHTCAGDSGYGEEFFAERWRGLAASPSLAELKNTLAATARELCSGRRPVGPEDNCSAIREVVAYIDGNYMQDITLGEAAGLIHLNPNYFCELFKREIGVTFKEYLLTRRIDQAKELLKRSNCKLNEVAELVGYNDSKHFGRSFKKMVGLTPGEYRELMTGHG